MNAIELTGLRKSYPGFTLQDVTLTVPAGSVVGIVGENGAGKSTLIKLILGAVTPEAGNIRVLGVDNQSSAFHTVKNDIGVVLDEAYFPEMLSPRNVGAIMKDTFRTWDEACYQRYLQRFALPEKKLFRDFSRGMKMKLALSVSLSHGSQLLLLDEATSGLDLVARDELLDLLNDYTREEDRSILISSHIVSDLEKICDYIAFLHKGKLLFCEEKDRLLEEYAVLKLSAHDFLAVPETAVVSCRRTPYGVEALVRSAEVSTVFPRERATLEEIILFLVKGGDKA